MDDDDNSFLTPRTPEQDEASDDVEPNPEAGVHTGGGPDAAKEPTPPSERAREAQGGL
jgi:hypothetical protein